MTCLFFISCWSNRGECAINIGPFASEPLAEYFTKKLERDGYTDIIINVLNPERNYPDNIMVDTY